jgi:hypothetical protein
MNPMFEISSDRYHSISQKWTFSGNGTISALPPKADIRGYDWNAH